MFRVLWLPLIAIAVALVFIALRAADKRRVQDPRIGKDRSKRDMP